MSRINKSHWFINENDLTISLMRFHVKIQLKQAKERIIVQLIITDQEQKNLSFHFNTLEEAITFTERIIDKSANNQEIIDKYMEFQEKKEKNFLSSQGEKKEFTIKLSPLEVEEAIVNYFGSGKNYKISIQEDVQLSNNKWQIYFYLTEHLNYDGMNKEHKYMLTKSDIKTALEAYVNNYHYDFIDYEYEGKINNNIPSYEGVKIRVKKKEKIYVKTFKDTQDKENKI